MQTVIANGLVLMNQSCFDEAGHLVMQIEPNMSEPFRSRAQQQLKLMLQFRNSEFPLANVLVRLFILDDEMELQMRSWLKGFIVQSCASFSF